MSTHSLVDPELLPGLDLVPSVQFSAEMLPAMRERMAQMAADRASAIPAAVSVERGVARAPGGHDVHLHVVRPHGVGVTAPAILYMHGGGYVLGSVSAVLPSNAQMAIDADCVVVSVDYRLAPETTFPGAIEDCYAALSWLHGNAGKLGVDPGRVVVAGESAGGGLAAALALLARDRAEFPVVHQHLIYPMLDDRTGPANANPNAGEFIWSAPSNVFAWTSMLGRAAGAKDVSPYAAAARAEDLANLPSAYIAVGALDLFAEENMEYARRLMRAGVPTELHVYPGAYHGFELAAQAQLTRRAHENSVYALRRALFPAGIGAAEQR